MTSTERQTPRARLSIAAVGGALSAVFVATYAAGVLFVLTAGVRMMGQMGHDGEMMSFGPGGIQAGLVGVTAAVLLAFWVALIFVPVHNSLQYLRERGTTASHRATAALSSE